MTKSEKRTLLKLVRQVVVARDGEKCLYCGTAQALNLSHIYPKGRHRRMEVDPENCKLLCYRHHIHFWHKSPIEAWEWLREKLPKERLDRLKLRANTIDKSPFDVKLYKLWLEKEIRRLSARR